MCKGATAHSSAAQPELACCSWRPCQGVFTKFSRFALPRVALVLPGGSGVSPSARQFSAPTWLPAARRSWVSCQVESRRVAKLLLPRLARVLPGRGAPSTLQAGRRASAARERCWPPTRVSSQGQPHSRRGDPGICSLQVHTMREIPARSV